MTSRPPLLLLIPILLLFATCSSTSGVDREQVRAAALSRAEALVQEPTMQAAFAAVERERDATIALWRELTEIPAPSGHEAARMNRIEAVLRSMGMNEVRRDAAGNLIAVRRGQGDGAHVVFDAHVDTIFPLDTPLTTRLENGRLHAPGVGDNTRNVVALLAMLRAMNEAGVQTRGDITFLFSVEEETTFRGVDAFLADHATGIDRWVTLDGGFGGFTYAAIGIYWDRYRVLGPGGHTLSAVPPYSAALPVARAISRLYELDLPGDTQLNVGMLAAADVFNAKASDAWFSVDLRSNDQSTLDRIDGEVERIVHEEANRLGMTARRETESKRAVAAIPGHRDSLMVATAEAVFRATGFTPQISDRASNHTSAALAAGVPAIGTGSTPCAGAHSAAESCAIEPLFHGIKRNITLAVALTQREQRRR